MKQLLILIFVMNSLFCFAQKENKITKLEIYGRSIYYGRSGEYPIGKSQIEKQSQIYLKIKELSQFEIEMIQKEIDNLVLSESQEDFGDYNALLIVHYLNKKKERYYIAGGTAGIYKENIHYDYSCSFISTVYSFLPIHYFNYKDNDDFRYKKYCEENN